MKKITSIILTLALTLSMTGVFASVVDYGTELQNQPKKVYAQTFSDVPKSYWAFNQISEMVSRGVLSGYPDGKFRPDDAVTREEFAKILCTAAGIMPTLPTYNPYNDMKYDDWSLPYIMGANKYLTYYKTDGYYFRPTVPATREDVAVSLVLVKGYDISVADVGMIKNMFSDFDSISESLQKYIAVAVSKGLMSGYEDSTFKAQGEITRAEAATLLWRAYQYGSGDKVAPVDETVTPTVTPTPTPTPEVNIDPIETPQPTVKPTPVPTPTPVPVKKEWKIETLTEATKVEDILYAKDGVYYYTGDNLIHFTDLNGITSVVCNIQKDLQPEKKNRSDADDNLKYGFMGYNNGKAYIVVIGSYNCGYLWDITDIKNVSYNALYYAAKGNSDIRSYETFLRFNGDKVYVDTFQNLYEFKPNAPSLTSDRNDYFHCYFINGEIYRIKSTENGNMVVGISKYNFSTGEFERIDYDSTVREYGRYPAGQYGNCLYFNNHGNIYKTDTNGTSSAVVLKDDVNVLDMKTFSLDMLSVRDDSNFAVYSDGAIRIISKN